MERTIDFYSQAIGYLDEVVGDKCVAALDNSEARNPAAASTSQQTATQIALRESRLQSVDGLLRQVDRLPQMTGKPEIIRVRTVLAASSKP